MTQSELESWVGRPLEGNEVVFKDFLVPAKTRKEGNVLVGMAFIECDKTFLSEEIPEGSKWSLASCEYDEGGNIISSTQKILECYTLNCVANVADTKCIVRLAAMESETSRPDYVTADMLALWLDSLAPNGFTIDTWMNREQRADKLLTAEYGGSCE